MGAVSITGRIRHSFFVYFCIGYKRRIIFLVALNRFNELHYITLFMQNNQLIQFVIVNITIYSISKVKHCCCLKKKTDFSNISNILKQYSCFGRD